MSTQQDVKRARIIAALLGAAVVITLCSLIYAQFQVTRANKLEREIDSLKMELESTIQQFESIR